MSYDPKEYWEERLERNFNPVGTGNQGMSLLYNQMLYRVRRHRLEKVLAQYKIDVTRARILDIGCGTGYFIECFKQWGAQDVTGVDITKTSIEKLQQRYPKYFFYEQDISQVFDLEMLGQYDLITCFDVMIHITDDERFATALWNIAAMLKRKGLFLCSDNFPQYDYQADNHVVFHSLDTYRQWFSQCQVQFIGLKPLFRWGFSTHPKLVPFFQKRPKVAEFLDKYLTPYWLCKVRLGVFRKL